MLLTLSASGQKNTLSAYSRYGVGVSRTATFNGNVGLSGTGQAWRPSGFRPEIYDSLARSGATFNDRNTNYINVINPASFSNYSLTTYEAGAYTQTVRYENGGQSERATFANFSHLALAFPIGSNWGATFGIKPFSQIGYDFQRYDLINGQGVTYDFEGSGGVNEIFVGTGVQLSENWSVGVNAKFLFGENIEVKRVVYGGSTSNFFNTLDQRNIVYNDFPPWSHMWCSVVSNDVHPWPHVWCSIVYNDVHPWSHVWCSIVYNDVHRGHMCGVVLYTMMSTRGLMCGIVLYTMMSTVASCVV